MQSLRPFRIHLLVTVLGALLPGALAQENTSPPVPPQGSPPSLNSTAEYRLGPGDLIELKVFGVEGFQHVLRVNFEGRITVPFLGPIQASGLTLSQLETQLTERIHQELVRNPQISLLVKEYRSQSVLILGAVRNPGQYRITQPLRLLDVLALAGGLDLEKAPREILIHRNSAPTSGEILRISLQDLQDGSPTLVNLFVEDGDVIQVPVVVEERFYVIGEVNRPGAFALPTDRDLFLSQALAWAGGPMKTAKLNKGTILRYETSGQRREIPVDVRALLEGARPDLTVEPNDVIFIPGSKIKTIGYGLLGIIPGTVSSVVVQRPFR